jgi:hypothetical protein
VLQNILLFLFVGSLIIVNGQQLSQASEFKLCYVVGCLIWALCGCILGQVQRLRNVGKLATFAMLLAFICVIVTIRPIAAFQPNVEISVLGACGSMQNPNSITPNAHGIYPPIVHEVGLPKTGDMATTTNGLILLIAAFVGASFPPHHPLPVAEAPLQGCSVCKFLDVS